MGFAALRLSLDLEEGKRFVNGLRIFLFWEAKACRTATGFILRQPRITVGLILVSASEQTARTASLPGRPYHRGKKVFVTRGESKLDK